MLLLLAGCAAPAPQPVPVPHAARSDGIVLAVRPVPPEPPEPPETARILVSGLGAPIDRTAIDPMGRGLAEYIVRTGTGTTLSIVQPRIAGLQPGEPVDLVTNGKIRLTTTASGSARLPPPGE